MCNSIVWKEKWIRKMKWKIFKQKPKCSIKGGSADSIKLSFTRQSDLKKKIFAVLWNVDLVSEMLLLFSFLLFSGKGRNLDVVELQCSICMKWFHKDCLSINLGWVWVSLSLKTVWVSTVGESEFHFFLKIVWVSTLDESEFHWFYWLSEYLPWVSLRLFVSIDYLSICLG